MHRPPRKCVRRAGRHDPKPLARPGARYAARQGGPAVTVGNVHVGPMIDQECDHVPLTAVDSADERSGARIALGINVDPVIPEHLGNADLAVERRLSERGPAAWVPRALAAASMDARKPARRGGQGHREQAETPYSPKAYGHP